VDREADNLLPRRRRRVEPVACSAGRLLAPVGVVASWNAIQARRKLFYALFLVQQRPCSAFLSRWIDGLLRLLELSLCPWRSSSPCTAQDGPKAALKFFLFTFIPSAPLLVAILGSTPKPAASTSQLFASVASGALPAAHVLGSTCVSLALPSRFPSSRCTVGWPIPSVKRLLRWRWCGRQLGFTQCCASTSAFPGAGAGCGSVLIASRLSAFFMAPACSCAARLLALMAYAALSHLSLITLGIYGLTLTGWGGCGLSNSEPRRSDGALSCCWAFSMTVRNQPN